MKHVSWGRLASVVAMIVAASACGGGADSRPSVDAIVASLDNADLVADLTANEVRCFAEQLHHGPLSSATLSKFVNDDDVTESDIDQFNSTADDAAAACGFMYVAAG